jgi:hypothetical protein
MKKQKTVTKNATTEQETPKPRTVLICAPSYDGKINAWHACALVETCKIGLMNNINIIPVYMSFDALIQRSRNDLFKLAVDHKVDDMIFADCDVDWNPTDIFKLLSHDVGVVAAPIVKKSDFEQYSVKISDSIKVLDNGLISVEGVGTGLIRIRSDIINKMWNASEEYFESHKVEPSRMVFEVKVIEGKLISEDIMFCKKVIELGEKIYVDPSINCGHSGEKRWMSDFYSWIKVHRNKG